jgi:hypothetical protein
MSNDTQTPNVNIGEQNVPENLAEQSGLPNMSSTKVFKVETDMIVEGDVYANAFIGDGSQLTGISGGGGGTYATLVGYNPADPSDLTSIVLDSKDGLDPATFRGDIINDSGSVIVDVSSPSATFSGTLLGTVAGNSTTLTGSHTILDVGTDGTDGSLDITDITADGTVDFTGATLIGISTGGLDSAAVEAMIDSDLVGAESPNSYTMKIGANADRIAIGKNAVSDRVNSISVGTSAGRYIDGGSGHVVIGDNAGGAAPGGGGQAHNIIAIGTNASTDISSAQYDTIAMGYNAGRTNMGNYAIAIGSGASMSDAGSESVALGASSNATGSRATAIGVSTDATGLFSVALGDEAQATARNAIAIGKEAFATSDYSVTIRTSAAGSLTYDTTNDWTFGAGVTMTDLTASGAVIFSNLPVIDPVNAGQLWNDNGTLKVSAG